MALVRGCNASQRLLRKAMCMMQLTRCDKFELQCRLYFQAPQLEHLGLWSSPHHPTHVGYSGTSRGRPGSPDVKLKARQYRSCKGTRNPHNGLSNVARYAKIRTSVFASQLAAGYRGVFPCCGAEWNAAYLFNRSGM